MPDLLRPQLLAVDTSEIWRELVGAQLALQPVGSAVVSSLFEVQTELGMGDYTGIIVGDMAGEWLEPLEMAQIVDVPGVLLTDNVTHQEGAVDLGFSAVNISGFRRASAAARQAIRILTSVSK